MKSGANDNPKDAQTQEQALRIVVSGVGLVSPIGLGAWPTFRAMLEGRTLADRVKQRTRHEAPYTRLDDPIGLTMAVGSTAGAMGASANTRSDPVVEIAERAALEACNAAGIGADERAGLAMVIGTSKGALRAMTRAMENVAIRGGGGGSGGTGGGGGGGEHEVLAGDAEAIALGPCGYVTNELRRRLGMGGVVVGGGVVGDRVVGGEVVGGEVEGESKGARGKGVGGGVGGGGCEHVVAACASGLVALDRARQILRAGRAKKVLVVSADSGLMPMLIYSYRKLGVLAPMSPPSGYVGRPLDGGRDGFVLAEQGAAVVLEIDDANGEPDRSRPTLVDTAVACEAYDLMRPAPEMPALRHVADRLIGSRKIDLLHPHTPGTPCSAEADHDATEMGVYESVLRTPPRDLYACKGAIGHGLGAAGLVSFVVACLCARTGQRPPMPWLVDPIHTWATREPTREPTHKPTAAGDIKTQAIFAAGFAGHVAGAVITSGQALSENVFTSRDR